MERAIPKCNGCRSTVSLMFVVEWEHYYCNQCCIEEALRQATRIAREGRYSHDIGDRLERLLQRFQERTDH